MSTKKAVLFVLAPGELIPNSPYTVENTDIVLDIPPIRNVPTKYTCTIATEEGELRETTIRYIRGCETILVEEQVKLGYSIDRHATKEEMEDLVIKNGQLLATRTNLVKYLRTIPLNTGAPNRPANIRDYFREVDPVAEQKEVFTTQFAIAKAKAKVFSLSEETTLDLLRMRYHGFVNTGTTDEEAKMQVLRMIDEEGGLEFFEKYTAVPAIEATTEAEAAEAEAEISLNDHDRLTILATKALEANILSQVSLPGTIAMRDKNKWVSLVMISDEGGEAAQFNQFVEWLKSDDGKGTAAVLASKLLANKK